MTARKSIFITGGASGIGRATAQHFAGKGWFVGLADLNVVGLAETAALLPAGQSACYTMNVCNREEWKASLQRFWQEAGERLDVLFNNAGIARGGPFAETDPADNDLVIEINCKGVLKGAEAGFSYLQRTPGSCLINTCSAAGMTGVPGMAAYCASKFAVRGMTESLDQEWEEFGIKVRSIMPGFIDTPLLNVTTAGSNRTARENVQEAGLEFTPVEEVAQAVWDAVHGSKVHLPVGKTAKQVAFALRWWPSLLKRSRGKLKRAG